MTAGSEAPRPRYCFKMPVSRWQCPATCCNGHQHSESRLARDAADTSYTDLPGVVARRQRLNHLLHWRARRPNGDVINTNAGVLCELCRVSRRYVQGRQQERWSALTNPMTARGQSEPSASLAPGLVDGSREIPIQGRGLVALGAGAP